MTGAFAILFLRPTGLGNADDFEVFDGIAVARAIGFLRFLASRRHYLPDASLLRLLLAVVRPEISPPPSASRAAAAALRKRPRATDSNLENSRRLKRPVYPASPPAPAYEARDAKCVPMTPSGHYATANRIIAMARVADWGYAGGEKCLRASLTICCTHHFA